MKKMLLFFSLSILSLSCNDDGVAPSSEPKKTFVTRVSYNGLNELELFYDIKGKLSRVNYYNGGALQTYTLYEYDEEGLKETRRFVEDDHSLSLRRIFTRDNFGRVIKAAYYSPPDFLDEPFGHMVLEYNTSGQLIARKYTPIDEPTFYRDDFTYDDKGNIITDQRTFHPTDEEKSSGTKYEYTPGDRSIPAGWKDILLALEISDLGDYLRTMFNSYAHQKTWNSDKVIVSEFSFEYSGKVFDDDGNLTYMVQTRKNMLKPENPDTDTEISYDYVDGN